MIGFSPFHYSIYHSRNSKSANCKSGQATGQQLGLLKLSSIFFMLIFGGFLSILILIYECCCNRPKQKDTKFHVKRISKFEYELRKLIHDFHGDLKADEEKVNFKYESTQSGSLKKHIIIIQVGQGNYKCNYCGKTFSQSGSLNLHTKTIHERKINHKGKFCEKLFSTTGNLKTHIKMIHEGNKDQNCEICSK